MAKDTPLEIQKQYDTVLSQNKDPVTGEHKPIGNPNMSDYGRAVMSQVSEPRTYDIHIGGVPYHEAIRMWKDGVRITGDPGYNPASPDSLTQSQLKPQPLFAPPVAQGRSKHALANDAFTESFMLGNMQNYEQKLEQKIENPTVRDVVVDEITRAMREQGDILTPVLQNKEEFLDLDVQDQLKILTAEAERLEKNSVTPKMAFMISVFRTGGGNYPYSDMEALYNKTPIDDMGAYLDRMRAQQRNEARRDIEATVAAQGFNNIGEALVDVIEQDFTPIVPLLSRLELLDNIYDIAGVEEDSGWGWFWIGSRRQKLREHFVSMSQEEFTEVANQLRGYVEETLSDPIKSQYVTKYGVLEAFEAIFTEDVIDGKSAENAGDVWFGNFETALEGLFSVMVMAKLGKGLVRSSFTAGRTIAVRNAARAAGDAAAARRVDEQIAESRIVYDLELDPETAVAPMLPRPPGLAIDELPDGSKGVALKNEGIRAEILDDTSNIAGIGLTTADRARVVNRQIADIDLNSGHHVQGSMNRLQMLDDDSGYSLRVVVGEEADHGFEDISTAVRALSDIDPHMTNVRLARINQNGELEDVFASEVDFARALTTGDVDVATAQRIIGDEGVDETFYLVYDQKYFWNTVDKEVFGDLESIQSGIPFPKDWLAPNAKFSDEFYSSFLKVYMEEHKLLKNFNLMFDPFYRLNNADKTTVQKAFEWMEGFAQTERRAPDITEIRAAHPDMTDAQLGGLVSLRQGMDTLYELFNRRLYREWNNSGFRTALPTRDSTLPRLHGRVLDNNTDKAPPMALDPVTGRMVNIKGQKLHDIYNAGGRVMKLDMPIQAGNHRGHRAQHVIVREDDYEVGSLSTRPLEYRPGYTLRFYEDPYIVVKKTKGEKVDGRKIKDGQEQPEGIAMAATQAEGESFARRAQQRDRHNGVEDSEWSVVRQIDIDQQEGKLFVRQALNREGRLFWDSRSFDRLPDVTGSRATLENPVTALERGLGMAARQATHEDFLKGFKTAWKSEFEEVLKQADIPKDLIDRLDLKELATRIKGARRNTADRRLRERLRSALRSLNYFRLIEGTPSGVLPHLREAALSAATAVNYWTKGNKTLSKLEKFAMTMDPFRAMRSVAFNAFLVFRPVRQALLQSAQVSYLAGIDPKYVFSTGLFRDALNLRRGVTARRKSGYNDGWSDKQWAKNMGLSLKEYHKLVKEFDRSGLIDLVDVHSFAGAAGRARKTAMPAKESPLGTVGYRARRYTRGVRDWMQDIGFNFGERNNLTFTYNIALRRLMKDKGYPSLLRLTKDDWEKVRVDASNLGLGMVKPNSFGYQQGAIGVVTQFQSFAHKAALGILGKNPALKGGDGIRILMGTYLLFGANMFGARDYAKQLLTDIGVSDQEILGGQTMVDFLSGGVIDTMFNMVMDITVEDSKDVSLGTFAPGIDVTRLWDMTLSNVIDQPYKTAFGPFGNIASNVLNVMDDVYYIAHGSPDIHPADKFAQAAKLLGSAGFPAFNDAIKAFMGYQMGIWYNTANEALPLRTTMNGLIARGVFGVRTKEELAYYRTQSAFWEDQENYNSWRDGLKTYFKTQTSLFQDGKMSREMYRQRLWTMRNLFEEVPEGVYNQLVQDIMKDVGQNDEILDTSLFKIIVEGTFENDSFNSWDDVIHAVDDMEDINPDQREYLKRMLKEASEGRQEVDRKTLEAIQQELDDGN
jgi:hypothetical protein